MSFVFLLRHQSYKKAFSNLEKALSYFTTDVRNYFSSPFLFFIKSTITGVAIQTDE